MEHTLPSGWVWTTLECVADLVGGGTPSREKPEYFGGSIPWFTPTEIDKTGIRVVTTSRERITTDGLAKSSARLVPAGTVLLTSRASIGNVAIAGNVVTTNQGFANLIPHSAESGYLAYWLWSKTADLVEMATGTTFKEITKGKLRGVQFPLPPLPEQRRIVEAIETQFTRLDAAEAALRRVQASLKRYRASVLKAACEGRLVPTEAELAHGEGRTYEPASILLERTLDERRTQWQAANPKKDYKEPAAPDVANLPDLPEGWIWATVEQLNPWNRPCAYGVLQPGPDLEGGVPFVRVGDVSDGQIEVSGLKRISAIEAARYPRTKLECGEVLITLVGAIGRTAVVPPSLAGANVARAVGVMAIVGSMVPEWVETWFRNPLKVEEMTGKAHEVARMTLNLEDVRSALVAVPPQTEQARIVAKAEELLSVVRYHSNTHRETLARATRLRQSILKRAFSGRLVAQDPTDEPASALLERIQAEREAVAPAPVRKGNHS